MKTLKKHLLWLMLASFLLALGGVFFVNSNTVLADSSVCNQFTGANNTACLTGYNAHANGTSESDACLGTGATITTDPTSLQACQNGWGAYTGGGPVQVPSSNSASSTSDPNSNANAAQVTCNLGKSPLTWIICPVLSIMQDTISYLTNQIVSAMTIPNGYFNVGTKGGSALYSAWSSMRNIALSLLVIAALIMVISQALSVGPLDAYTVKKLLPRIVIAIIIVALSWPLMGLLVGVSNGIGAATRSLIYAPFASLPNVSLDSTVQGLLSGGILVGGAALAAVGGLGVILLFALTAFLAVMTAFLTIVFRQMLVIFLTILAPVAIVLYILPGTERVGKMWWTWLWRALIAFPLIEAFIAIGGVFSKISANSGGGSLVSSLIAIFAIYVPFFLLPMTFRVAGGALAGVSGAIENVRRPAAKGLGNLRRRQVGTNWQKMQTGNRFRQGSLMSKSLGKFNANDALFGVSHIGEYGFNPLDKKRRERIKRQHGWEERAEYMKSGQFQDVAEDNIATLGAFEFARTGDEGKAIQAMQQMYGIDYNTAKHKMDAAKVAARSGSREVVMQSMAIARGGLTGAYGEKRADETEEAFDARQKQQAMTELALASGATLQGGTIAKPGTVTGGDASARARMTGEYRSVASGGGFGTRAGASWGKFNEQLEAVSNGGKVENVRMMGELAEEMTANDFSRLKPSEQEQILKVAQIHLNNLIKDGKTSEATALRAGIQQWYNSPFYLSGKGATQVQHGAVVDAYNVDTSGGGGRSPSVGERVTAEQQQDQLQQQQNQGQGQQQ